MSADSLAAPARLEGRLPAIYLYGALFALAVGAFCLAQAVGHRLGLASEAIAVAGDATCGWSWLLVRALFQPPRAKRPVWPLALVLFLVGTGAFLRLADDSATALPRMVANLGSLVSSTLLLLAAIEPLRGLGVTTDLHERRFRVAFAAGYAALLVIAVVWVDGAPAGGPTDRWGATIKAACAVLALLGMALAIAYRRGHPLPQASRARRRPATDDETALADRLRGLMADEAIYTHQNLRVADLARALGEAEYKVSQSITGGLGFRNFNQMANHYRIQDAKRRLAEPANAHLPILTIAFDCGFGSIGPFNRAFKAQTGLTPMAFRQANCSQRTS